MGTRRRSKAGPRTTRRRRSQRLQRAYETDANGSFVDAVIEAREHLTLLFFDVAEERVRSLEAPGDAASASALDEACAAIAARAQYTVDTRCRTSFQ